MRIGERRGGGARSGFGIGLGWGEFGVGDGNVWGRCPRLVRWCGMEDVGDTAAVGTMFARN